MTDDLKNMDMNPAMTALGEVFEERLHQVSRNHNPEWPWMENGKPVVPDGPRLRTHENYKKAAAYLVYKMEVHRGGVSRRKTNTPMEEA